jgi:hypothetical protein
LLAVEVLRMKIQQVVAEAPAVAPAGILEDSRLAAARRAREIRAQ